MEGDEEEEEEKVIYEKQGLNEDYAPEERKKNSNKRPSDVQKS